MTKDEIINSFLEFSEKYNIIKIFFIKKDNSIRELNGTINFNLIPKDKKPKQLKINDVIRDIKKGLMRIFDIDKQEWRSFDILRLLSIETEKEKIEFMKKEKYEQKQSNDTNR